MDLIIISGYVREHPGMVYVVTSILMCKIVYDLTGAVSSAFVERYNKLNDVEKLEWNNRGMSTFHAVAGGVISVYLLVISDLFVEGAYEDLIVHRRSTLSDALEGISLGYFLCDLVMVFRHFPVLGGIEYVIHHGLCMVCLASSLATGQAVVYIMMFFITESTTPFVNLRWYLDATGMKNSKLYTFNGIALFFGWLVARILLLIYFFYHLYIHLEEAKTMSPLAIGLCIGVPPVLAVMNLVWFWKITRGLIKALYKTRYNQ